MITIIANTIKLIFFPIGGGTLGSLKKSHFTGAKLS
jgi:hypothetical protein